MFYDTIARSHQNTISRQFRASQPGSVIHNRNSMTLVERLSLFNPTSRILVSTAREVRTKSLLNAMRHYARMLVSCPAHPQRIPFLTKSLLSQVFQPIECNLMTNGFRDRNLLHIKILTHCDPSFFVEMDTAPFCRGARDSPFLHNF